ncbi:hypothetical protein LJB83_01420 [Clostridia bacterium OttesenSCG-928-F22]|nr:hypothetical protein [Clostridia bacterium OttesenSCG-928-F22]
MFKILFYTEMIYEYQKDVKQADNVRFLLRGRLVPYKANAKKQPGKLPYPMRQTGGQCPLSIARPGWCLFLVRGDRGKVKLAYGAEGAGRDMPLL